MRVENEKRDENLVKKVDEIKIKKTADFSRICLRSNDDRKRAWLTIRNTRENSVRQNA